MLHSLQESKSDASLLLLLLPQQQQQTTQFQRVDYISVICNKCLYAYMPHTYATVN